MEKFKSAESRAFSWRSPCTGRFELRQGGRLFATLTVSGGRVEASSASGYWEIKAPGFCRERLVFRDLRTSRTTAADDYRRLGRRSVRFEDGYSFSLRRRPWWGRRLEVRAASTGDLICTQTRTRRGGAVQLAAAAAVLPEPILSLVLAAGFYDLCRMH